jgi:hypothetical protein
VNTLLLAVVGALCASQLEMRGGEAPPQGRILTVDVAGVTLGGAVEGPSASQPAMIVGWDRVRTVDGELEAAARPYLPSADRAWRARMRLARGDPVAAEPLFEELFGTYRGLTGPTAAVVAEGLLRCRLRRGAHVSAIDPWLALRAASAGGTESWLHADWSAQAGMPPILDAETGLVPGIPPIWVGSAAARAMSGLRLEAPGGDPAQPSRVLGQLYLAAAEFEAGRTPELPIIRSTDAGVRLVFDVVRSRVASAPDREEARRALADRIARAGSPPPDGTPPWMEAWCRAALGRSMILEQDEQARQLGIVEMLQVPARFSVLHPYLAGTALAEASVALRDMGDTAGADVLRAELMQRYPDHPVLEWERIQRTTPRPAAPSGK